MPVHVCESEQLRQTVRTDMQLLLGVASISFSAASPLPLSRLSIVHFVGLFLLFLFFLVFCFLSGGISPARKGSLSLAYWNNAFSQAVLGTSP